MIMIRDIFTKFVCNNKLLCYIMNLIPVIGKFQVFLKHKCFSDLIEFVHGNIKTYDKQECMHINVLWRIIFCLLINFMLSIIVIIVYLLFLDIIWLCCKDIVKYYYYLFKCIQHISYILLTHKYVFHNNILNCTRMHISI